MEFKIAENTLMYFYFGNGKHFTTNIEIAIQWLKRRSKVSVIYIDKNGVICEKNNIKNIIVSSAINFYKCKIIDENDDKLNIVKSTKFTHFASFPEYIVEKDKEFYVEPSFSVVTKIVKSGHKVKARFTEKDCTTTTSFIVEFGFLNLRLLMTTDSLFSFIYFLN